MAEGELETQEVEESKGGEAQATEATPAAEPPVQKRATVAGLKKELDELRQDVNRDVLEWLGQLDVRLEEVEKRTAQHNETLLGDVKTRLEALDNATGAIMGALRSHINEAEELPQTPAAAAGFAEAPVQPEDKWGSISDIQGIAEQAQTMTDVLMICRFLKAVPTLTDAERNKVLEIATGAAGAQITHGLRIRAGVKNVGA